MTETSVAVPFSLEQEQLVHEHLFNDMELYVAPGEHQRLIGWVNRKLPGHKIKSAHIDLQKGCWFLDLEKVTVTT